jgi:2-polyprenyl-3-methyl-5-hydroxy-6-metoxy-1,4-benzoquinol methylase
MQDTAIRKEASPAATAGDLRTAAATHARCRFCDTQLKHTVANLGMSPMANAIRKPEELNRMEPFFPLHAYVCGNCFLVQLEEFQSGEAIFTEYSYFSSYVQAMLDHGRKYADDMTTRFGLGPQSKVVEIAANDGYLLRWFLPKGVPVLGVEPAANVAEAGRKLGIPMEVLFFGQETARQLKAAGHAADLMAANNVVAHVPDLNDFVAGFRELLKPTGVATFEFHHVLNLLTLNQFDNIYHEHFCYHSFMTFSRILAHHGLKVFDVEEIPNHGGSLRVYCQPEGTGVQPVDGRVGAMIARERSAGLDTLAPYLEMEDRIRATKRSLWRFVLQASEEGKRIAAYGAPAKAATLLNYAGVRSDYVEYTVDRNPHKQNHFLPGTQIPIYGPERIEQTRPDYLVILAWNLKDEVMRQMSHIREWGGKFVVLIPEVKIYD